MKYRVCLGLLAALSLCATLGVRAETAEPVPQSFSIPAQPLSSAISSFARQSGWQVSVRAELAAGQLSSAVSGSATAAQALTQMLTGTGLQWTSHGARSAVILPAPGSAPRSSTLDTVHVRAGRRPGDEAYEGAGTVNIITREQLERFRGTSVGDIFQGTPGVMVGENRNSGGLDINIRGMQGQGRAPVLVDGARQETTVYRGYAGVVSRSYIDPDLIGSVRIDKGPTMAAEGTGAVGGLVRMNTLSADDIAKPGQRWGVRLRAGLSGNNSGSPAAVGTKAGYNIGGFGTPGHFRTDCRPGSSLCDGVYSLDNAYPDANTRNRPDALDLRGEAFSLAATTRQTWADLVLAYARRSQGNYYAGTRGPTPTLDLSERYDRGFYTEVRPRVDGASRFLAGEQVVNTHFESESLLLKSSFMPGDEHALEFSYLRYDSDYGELMPSELLWLGRARQTSGSSVLAQTWTGRYQWQPVMHDALDIDLRLWHTDTESLNNSYSEQMLEALYGGDRPGPEHYQRWGGDLANTMVFPRLNDLQLRYGVAFQQERMKPADDEPGNRFQLRDGQRREESAFVAFEWTFLPRLTLDAGIRYTRYRAEDNTPVLVDDPDSPHCQDDGADGCVPLFNDYRGSGSAPLVSLLWEPRDGLQFYGKYAEALRMPSLFETTVGFSVATIPGQVLRPEHTRNRELGINLIRDDWLISQDRLRATLAWFDNRTEDYLTRTIPNTWDDTSVGPNATLFRMHNIESIEFRGVEASLAYDPGRAYIEVSGTRYDHIELCHTGSYRRERCSDYGLASSYVNNMIPPNWQASATLGVRQFQRRLEWGARGTWTGARNRTPEYNDQTAGRFSRPIPWHQYRVFDAFASWIPNDTFRLDANVDNVTDEYYLDALSLGMVPAPGRTVRLNATLHF